MYCTGCGKEIKEGWIICPSCGKAVNGSETVQGQETQSSINERYLDAIDKAETYDINKIKKVGRLLLKVLALIAIVCFFCPSYMVSCSGQELFSLNGLDMTFGFEYLGEEIGYME